jgi:hypothetical protein
VQYIKAKAVILRPKESIFCANYYASSREKQVRRPVKKVLVCGFE